MDEYKYQISITDGKGGIYVARGDTKEEVVLDIEWFRAKTKLPVANGATGSNTIAPSVGGNFCVKHQKEMKEREFKDSVWHDHRRKLDDGTWEQCKGFGYPSELKKAVEESGGY